MLMVAVILILTLLMLLLVMLVLLRLLLLLLPLMTMTKMAHPTYLLATRRSFCFAVDACMHAGMCSCR